MKVFSIKSFFSEKKLFLTIKQRIFFMMNARMHEILPKHRPSQTNPVRPWYENADGTCKVQIPTLVSMGEDRPQCLMFPAHWSQSSSVLPKAKNMASELDAILVLLIYGDISYSEITALILELAEDRILPLWIGENNRKKFDRIVGLLCGQSWTQNLSEH